MADEKYSDENGVPTLMGARAMFDAIETAATRKVGFGPSDLDDFGVDRLARTFEFPLVKAAQAIAVFDVVRTEDGDQIVAGIDMRFVRDLGRYVITLYVCQADDLNTRTPLELYPQQPITVVGAYA